MTDPLRASLLAARASIDAALALLDDEEEDGASADPAACQHPRRETLALLGGRRRWYCPDCGATRGDDADGG